MKRVYIDSNVFRFLKKRDNDFYSKLYNDLNKLADRFIYYFSHAHILDLTRDKTDHKFDDLKFMEEFVKSNYLFLPHKKNVLNVQIATPTEAFQGQDESKPLKEYFNFGELFDDKLLSESPEMVTAKETLNKLMGTTFKVDLKSNLEGQPEGIKNLWRKLVPELKDEYKFSEWLDHMSDMFDNIYEDKSIYKDIRRHSLENLDLTKKYNIDISSFSFDEDLKNTPLQKSFLELVEESISHNKDNQDQREFNYFITAFNLLNILGIDKESNSKAQFANTIHDSQHAFYAAHCDYLVSDDEGLILKAKVLYKLLEIETNALTIDEFGKFIDVIAGQNDLNINGYLKFLQFELKNTLIIDKKYSLKYNREYITFKTSAYHFGYFNRFDFIDDKDEGQFYVFYNGTKNYSRFISYVELEFITNRIVALFGKDNYFKGKYTSEDTKAIGEGTWQGRTWIINEMEFILEYNIGKNKLCFTIEL